MACVQSEQVLYLCIECKGGIFRRPHHSDRPTLRQPPLFSAVENMRKSRFRLYTLVLPLICAAVFSIVDPGDTFQMKSVFGLPPVAAKPEQIAVWPEHPAPTALTARAGLPPLRAITYNLHSGFGAEWSLFASRTEVEANLRSIARHIVKSAPAYSPVDVVGLNEVDFLHGAAAGSMKPLFWRMNSISLRRMSTM